MIYRVSDATLTVITRHETTVVGWGFALAAIIIILFGLYLRHASRSVLMNIINAIKTGDVNGRHALKRCSAIPFEPIKNASWPMSVRPPMMR